MPELIFGKINVSKIAKDKMFKGRDGTYLDIALLPNRDGEDSYGNHYMIVQSVSKEDKAKGIKGAILGNAKIYKRQASEPRQERSRPEPAAKPLTPEEKDDVPF